MRNALAERDMAAAERSQAQQQQNALFQQQRVLEQDRVAEQERASASEKDDRVLMYNYLSHLSKVRSNPQVFEATRQRMLQSPLFQKYEIKPEDLTPEELDDALPAFAAEAGIAPAPDPVRFETVQGPRGSRLKRNTITGEEIQVVGPEASGGDGPRAPSAYMFTPEGGLVPIPGGPADPNRPKGPASRREAASLRKEFEGMPAVKDYRTVLPLLERASTAPNTRAGDVSIIYALGKMFDPTSVVREGELVLAQGTAPWLRKLASKANSQISGEGALNPETRKEIMATLQGQVDALRQPYEQERQRFATYAQDYELDPFAVVGGDVNDAFGGGDVPTATGPNGQKLYLRNGKWVPQ
jgi:hypothetical protein